MLSSSTNPTNTRGRVVVELRMHGGLYVVYAVPIETVDLMFYSFLVRRILEGGVVSLLSTASWMRVSSERQSRTLTTSTSSTDTVSASTPSSGIEVNVPYSGKSGDTAYLSQPRRQVSQERSSGTP